MSKLFRARSQLTIRPVNTPFDTRNKEVSQWVQERMLDPNQIEQLNRYLDTNGFILLKKNYGAIVYDIYGYNVCMTNCFTYEKNRENVRQLIFFPNGAVRYDWQYNAVLLAPLVGSEKISNEKIRQILSNT